MYSNVHGECYTKYLADPTNPEAQDVMWRVSLRKPSDTMAKLQSNVAGGLSILGSLACILGVFIPEPYDLRGLYDFLGVASFVVLEILAVLCWWHKWIWEIGVESMKRRFRELVKAGEIVEVPYIVSSGIDERLGETKDFFLCSYQGSAEDFAAIKPIAEAHAKGTISNKTREEIESILDAIVRRIRIAYDDARAITDAAIAFQRPPEQLPDSNEG